MALLTAGGVLLAGCRATPSQKAQVRPHGVPESFVIQNQATPDPAEQARIDAHAHYAAGIVHAASGDPALALDEFHEAALSDPANETLALEVSMNFARAGQLEKAATLLERSAERPESSGALFARLGAIYFQLNKLDLAARANRIAIKKSPRLLAGYQNLFLIYAQNKQPKEARAMLDDAAKVSQPDAEYLIALGGLYARLAVQFADEKQTATARAGDIFQRAAKMNPRDPDLRLLLADGLSSVGKNDEAGSIYLELLQDMPDVPVVRENVRAKLADIYLRSNDPKRATNLLQAIIRDHPTDARAYYFLGSIAMDETNHALAAECFSKTILLNPNFEPAYSELASVQLAENKPTAAQATLEAGRGKFPGSFPLRYLSGIVASHLKNYISAVQYFTEAEVIAQAMTTGTKPLNYIFYFQFGAACERRGDIAQAEKQFEKCLQLSPNFDEAQNYLGFMWADHGTNLARARDLIESALKAEPKNAAYLDSMAWVLFKQNQPGEALEFELKALANSEEDDAEIFHHLGDIYAALGQTEKAREAWRKSLGVEPNDDVRKKLGENPK